jgi:hypothetical protein
MNGGEANKPSSVTRSRGWRAISLGPVSPRASCSLPGTVNGPEPFAGRAAPRPCSALLRVGFALPPTLPPGRCALTATVSPLPVLPAGAIGGLFSVALSVASRRPAVSRHPALWSSDFPRRHPKERRGPHSPPDPSCQTVPRRGLEPPRRLRHQILSLACLPVSAPGQCKGCRTASRTVLPRGLEPPRACAHWILNPARLPIPPQERGCPQPAPIASGECLSAVSPPTVRPERFELPAF